MREFNSITSCFFNWFLQDAIETICVCDQDTEDFLLILPTCGRYEITVGFGFDVRFGCTRPKEITSGK